MGVTIGPVELPRWALIVLIAGGGYLLINQGKLPAVDGLFGISLPLQDLLLLVALIGLALGLLHQFSNILGSG